jgi:hypothetical protein
VPKSNAQISKLGSPWVPHSHFRGYQWGDVNFIGQRPLHYREKNEHRQIFPCKYPWTFFASCGSSNKATLLECKIHVYLVPVIVEKDRIVLQFAGGKKVYDLVPDHWHYVTEEDASLIDHVVGRPVFVTGFISRGSGNLWISDSRGAKHELLRVDALSSFQRSRGVSGANE